MLKELKSRSLSLGVITNGKGKLQMDSIEALGIKPYFDTILISEWEGLKKPQPEIFLKAVNSLNLSSGECVFVGDHPENDVRAANAVGMTSIWKRDHLCRQVEADYIINGLDEIPRLLSAILQKTPEAVKEHIIETDKQMKLHKTRHNKYSLKNPKK
jgi:putative hydrolase of the HAD superfamily